MGTIFFRISLLGFFFLAATVAYYPGLSGPFVFDDLPNIVRNQRLQFGELTYDSLLQATLSGYSGPLGRPVSMLSFALNIYFFGLDPFYFKLVNLLIHFVNSAGLFALSYLILDKYRSLYSRGISDFDVQLISALAGAVWLLHPFNLTSVLYVVQRMTSLSAFFVISGMILYFKGRDYLTAKPLAFVFLCICFFVLFAFAVLSKETGVLLLLYIGVLEFSFFFVKRKVNFLFLDRLFSFFVIVAPVGLIIIFTCINWGGISEGYLGRNFSLSERLMTEARVVWFYFFQTILPVNSSMALYHDDITISRAIFSPPGTALAIVGIFVSIFLAVILRFKAPLLSFGILFFFVGHLLESSVFPLELVHEHRNYLPGYGLILASVFYLVYPLRYIGTLHLRRFLAFVMLGLFCFNTYARSLVWSNPVARAEKEVQDHPASPRANGEIGTIYASIKTSNKETAKHYYLLARYYYNISAELEASYLNGLFGILLIDAAQGLDVDRKILGDLISRLEKVPLSADVGGRMLALVSCKAKGICRLTNSELQLIFDSVFKNKSFIGARKSAILSSYSYFQVNELNDYSAALETMVETANSAPDELEYRMTLVKFLNALGRFKEAEENLAIVTARDRFGSYKKDVKHLMVEFPSGRNSIE